MVKQVSAAAKSANKTGRSGFFPQIYRRTFKRVFDITLALMLALIVLPILVVLYFLVKQDGGPAFFGHERVGLNGRKFKCWKVRSMVPDAKERLEALLASDPAARAEWQRDRKLTNDPRVTPFGNFLRKSSLDELPQLLNVLRGEMSLVGPRPVPLDELEANYEGYKWIYQSVRPGITGLWQVSGRNDVSYAERVRMDVEYYHGHSLAMDLRILLGTVAAVTKRTGR